MSRASEKEGEKTALGTEVTHAVDILIVVSTFVCKAPPTYVGRNTHM